MEPGRRSLLPAHRSGETKRTVNALTWRIGLSVALIAVVILGIYTGWIKPHGLGR